MDISAWIAHWAGWIPGKTALRFEEHSITYDAFEGRVAHTAGLLKELGTCRGDRVAYLGPNCPELLDTLFACARLGAMFVPLNARMPAAELRVFVQQSEPRFIVTEGTFEATAGELTGDAIVSFVAGHGVEPDREVALACCDHELDDATPLVILYTSGTTGTAKGAVHSHESLATNADDAIAATDMTSYSEILTVAPMFHIAGMNITTTPAIRAGATVTIHRAFDPGHVLHDIQGFGVTHLLLTPPITAALAADAAWTRTDLSSLRCVLTGGQFIVERAIRPWAERGVPIAQGYGLTEAGPVVTTVPIDSVPEKSLTAGKPALHCRVRIVDGDGREVRDGETGEVVIRSRSVMLGYWRNEAATRAAIADGWFRTGDLGSIDDEGYLHIIDRLKEVIIVGVSNVYPTDLESVLAEHPEIREAAVVGRPDDELGEVPIAFVVRAPGSSLTVEEVSSFFDGRLAQYKHPRDVVFLDSLPRTALGKVEKARLRALVRAQPISA